MVCCDSSKSHVLIRTLPFMVITCKGCAEHHAAESGLRAKRTLEQHDSIRRVGCGGGDDWKDGWTRYLND